MMMENWSAKRKFDLGGPPAPAAPGGRPRRSPPVFSQSLTALCTVAAGVLILCLASNLPAQSRTGSRPAATVPVQLLADIARVENQRGKHGTPIATLLPHAQHSHPAVRLAVVRALGRQQDTAFVPAIRAMLNDAVPSVREAAVDALGQAAQALRGAPPPQRAAAASFLTGLSETIVSRAGEYSAATGMSSRTLGRLPWPDSVSARAAEQKILALAARRDLWGTGGVGAHGVLHGLYSLARARRTLGAPAPAAIALMERLGRAQQARTLPEVRRLALLGLSASGGVSAAYLREASTDTDEQVRRLAVLAPMATPDADLRRGLLSRGLRDASPIVRHEAVRQWRSLVPAEGCAELINAVADGDAHVAIAAIDGIAAQCAQHDGAVDLLAQTIQQYAAAAPNSTANPRWQLHAHALLGLTRVAPDRARPEIRRSAQNTAIWGVRLYAVQSAAIARDTITLYNLLSDASPNVQASAIDGLAGVVGHAADSLYITALGSPHYQVVMAAARALRGTPRHPPASEALIRALSRVTAERRENTRDARLAILERLTEVAQSVQADVLRPYVTDFDSTVAVTTASLVGRLIGAPVSATPRLLVPQDEAIAPLLSGEWSARITMRGDRGNEVFTVRLFPAEAPYTVARFVRLARAGYYNGLTFHRVEPGFVIQGGSPSAVEYVGDGPFMRDEVGPRSHTRGTLGISTRGRDTGDAQIFVNLTDNYRLDHDYTVFAEIVAGQAIAERVREADTIHRVEIVRR